MNQVAVYGKLHKMPNIFFSIIMEYSDNGDLF